MSPETTALYHTAPDQVHEILRKYMLVDGFDMVYDPAKSHGSTMIDARNGDEVLDLFSFFASQPIGHNHPGMQDPAFRERLLRAALVKPTNSDVYTQEMADFVATFGRTLPEGFRHLFFIEGGGLAVENALKAAFDWKVRKNIAAGRGEHLGSQVIHFDRAFHGRTGYTLSLTNTFDPRKTQYFPKFDWPRVSSPWRRFPATPENDARAAEAEAHSLAEIKDAIARNPHDIAAIIIETIQGEGGDNHWRPEFLQALRDLCDAEEIILIFDEVQAGMGLTGRWWAFENYGVSPDVFSFGKKAQVCGIAATSRFDEVDSVFEVSSRINSTWGGGLVDMVRCQRYIEIIEEHDLLRNAREVGAYAREKLGELAVRHPNLIDNVRGVGLMCAFDLPSHDQRDRVQKALLHRHVAMLPSGEKSLRFRPVLDFTRANVDLAVERIEAALGDA